MPAEATDGASELSLHDKLLSKINLDTVDPVETTPEESTVPVEEVPETDEQVTELPESEGAEANTEVPEESAETQEGEELPAVETLELTEIASYIGYDHEKLDVTESGELIFKTKIDGEEGQATLSELVKNHQLEGHLNKRNMEVTELKKQLDTQLQDSKTQLADRIQKVEDLATIMYQELTKEYDSVDWNDLRANDPGEYSARQTDYQNRQNQLLQQYQTLQAQKQESQTATDQASNQGLQDQRAKLVEAMGWTDAVKSKKEFDDISLYAVTSGYTQEEFNDIPDHRVLVALSKAAKYDALQKESPRITNKVRKAPKIVKPGTVKSKPSNVDELVKLRSNIKTNDGKNGSIAQFLLKSGRI